MGITKRHVIGCIAERTGISRATVKAVVQEFLHEIVKELARGNRLEFRDFGVFETKTTPARTARNPRTQKKVYVPARRRVAFKAGRLMKEALNADNREPPLKRT